MPDVDWLRSLIERVPVLVVDKTKARQTGDRAALEYAAAMAEWQREAAQALSEAERPGHDLPDAFARTATAAALLRIEAAE